MCTFSVATNRSLRVKNLEKQIVARDVIALDKRKDAQQEGLMTNEK
ncbi:hypothetical protein KKI19_02155 [Patescibacteria group bacterium]|nr:hypothetical protein [Patescibacteria group bacterium]